MRYETKRRLSRILDVIYPRKCSSCRKRVTGEYPICDECLERLSEERELCCSLCGRKSYDCDCGTLDISVGSIASRRSLSLLIYQSGGNRVTENIIHRFKVKNNRGLSRYIARDIASHLLKLIMSDTVPRDEYVIVYPPRSLKRMEKLGFDHMREFVKLLSEYTGIPVSHALKRREGSEQKNLSAPGRAANAFNSLYISKPEQIRGRHIILADDIITTGATMAAASRLLSENGAVSVFPLSIAKTKRG